VGGLGCCILGGGPLVVSVKSCCVDATAAAAATAACVPVLRKGLNTTAVRWDSTQHSPYFNYRAADGSIHQVGARTNATSETFCVNSAVCVSIYAL